MQNITPTHALGMIDLRKPSTTVGTFDLDKANKHNLIKRMKKTLVPFNGKTIKTNKL